MESLAFDVNEKGEDTNDDEELLGGLIATVKALGTHNLKNMDGFHIVDRLGDKKVIEGRWVLQRNRTGPSSNGYVPKLIAKTNGCT